MPIITSYNNILSRRFAFQLVRSRTVEADLATIRETLDPATYGPFQDELRRAQQGTVRVAAILVAPTLAQLARITYSKLLEPERELKWARSVLTRYAPEIAEFLSLKQTFSRAILVGEYVTAKACLDRIEAVFGQSFWLIKNRLALSQLSQGLEPQKRYAQQLKEAVAYIGPIAVVTQWVSVRNESTVTLPRFETDFEQFLARIAPHIPESLPDYLRHHILAPTTTSPEAALHVLRIESARALIDFYEAFVAYGQAVAQLGSVTQRNLFLYALRKLLARLSDSRLPVLLTALDQPATGTAPIVVSTASYDALCSGDYSAAYVTAQRDLVAATDDVNSLLISALGSALAGATATSFVEPVAESDSPVPSLTVQAIMQRGLQAIVLSGTAAHQEIRELGKLTANFASLEWTAAFQLIVADETSSQPSVEPAAAALRAPTWHPLLLVSLGRTYATPAYISAVTARSGASLGLNYALASLNECPVPTESLSVEAAQLLTGQQHFFLHQYAEAMAAGRSLTASRHSYFQRRGYRLAANSLLRAGNLSATCTYIAEVYVREAELQPLLPIAEAVGDLRPNQAQWQALQASLALPILLDAHTKYINRATESLCGYAYEDFLTANGLERPSQLQALCNRFDLPQLIYYLRYICVEAVMDASVAYQGSHEVSEERLKVCRLLVELDPEHEADYRLEIRDLVRRQVISNRKREVEQSRIHIELPKLHHWAADQLQEAFNRYITFIRAGLDAETTAIRAEAAARASEQDLDGLLAMSVPNNETLGLFSNLVLEISNAYTSSAEFGLNRYLSTRIRHGTLETQLRWPVTAHRLITQRESENGPYQENAYWPTQLSLSIAESTALNKVFADFSAAYDQLITTIRTDWVQIRSRPEQNGMFHFALAGGEIAWLAAQVTPNTSFREFVDIVVDHLGQRLTTNLSLIRQRLRTEALPAARELLSSLQHNVQALNLSYMFSELDAAINLARTETAAVFERVAAWFRPTQEVGNSPYFLEDVLSVAEALVREAAPTFQAPLMAPTDDEFGQVILGHGLTTLVDIFVNVFENVIRRSGLEIPLARIELVDKPLTPEHSVVSIITRNALGASINREELQQQLTQKRRELDEGKYASSIAKEGGSGFFKIHRSLRDLRASEKEPEAALTFGIEEDEFFVDVQLPVRWRTHLVEDDAETTYEHIDALLNNL